MDLTQFERLQAAANHDPEFRMAARFWDAVLRITMGETAHLLYIRFLTTSVRTARVAVRVFERINNGERRTFRSHTKGERVCVA